MDEKVGRGESGEKLMWQLVTNLKSHKQHVVVVDKVL